jgi:hypothetical protein
MAAIRTLVDNKLGALQNLCAFSKVDYKTTLWIRADQKVLHELNPLDLVMSGPRNF